MHVAVLIAYASIDFLFCGICNQGPRTPVLLLVTVVQLLYTPTCGKIACTCHLSSTKYYYRRKSIFQ